MFLRNCLTLFKPLLTILLVSSGVLFASVHALENSTQREIPSWDGFAQHPQDGQFHSVIQPVKWAREQSSSVRSKSAVVKQIKQRYNAKVLRISLNNRGDMYNVRILMPSGKMRDIQVSARR